MLYLGFEHLKFAFHSVSAPYKAINFLELICTICTVFSKLHYKLKDKAMYAYKAVPCRMWANAQRDGRPAEYRWRPLFNAAKFSWCPLLECRAVTLPRCESHWNLQGCPKLANRSLPLVGRSSYYENMWRRYRCLTSFFLLLIHASAAKIQPDKVVRSCHMATFLRPVFAASRVPHISDMHSKFALGPHHVWKYGRHSISGRWD